LGLGDECQEEVWTVWEIERCLRGSGGDWGLGGVMITRRVRVVRRSSLEDERGRPGEQFGHARTRLGPRNEDTFVIEADASCSGIIDDCDGQRMGMG
jgi:hypothetical protein